jgi:dethiobiotin synthetase
MKSLLITSTDTEVGKTLSTCALGAYFQTHFPRRRLGLMKPIQCGEGDSSAGTYGDRELYQQIFQLDQSPEELNPLYFEAPIAPPLAAALAGRSIDLAKVWKNLQGLQQRCDWVLVEGAGSLGTPITAELTWADLAREWRLPTVLVVPVKLGAIGQAVAFAALAKQANVDLRGIILNCVQPTTAAEIAQLAPTDLIVSLTHIPVLGCLPYLADQKSLVELTIAAQGLEWEILLC